MQLLHVTTLAILSFQWNFIYLKSITIRYRLTKLLVHLDAFSTGRVISAFLAGKSTPAKEIISIFTGDKYFEARRYWHSRICISDKNIWQKLHIRTTSRFDTTEMVFRYWSRFWIIILVNSLYACLIIGMICDEMQNDL